MGKGSNRRPGDNDAFRANWERIFGEGSARDIETVPPPERVGQAPGVEGAEFVEDKVEAG